MMETGTMVTLTPEMIENVRDASALARLATSWGHRQSDDGRRLAGYYYRNDDAIREDVLPAHCLSATRDLVLFLAAAIDASPNTGQ